jgi:hypothetical protein
LDFAIFSKLEGKMDQHTTSNVIEWKTPVYVRIGHGASETINGPQQALNYLSMRWPAERGSRYSQAKAVCAGAVDRTVYSEVAREAFIAAAIEAYILA